MSLNPPPSTSELLERDRDGRFTGKMGSVWVRWFGPTFQAILDAANSILTVIADLATETAARIAADTAEATARAAADTTLTNDLATETTARQTVDGILAGVDAAHVAAADPHTQYQKESEKNTASGYAGLDGSTKLTGSQQVYGTSSNTAAEGNDSRLVAVAAGLAGTKVYFVADSSGGAVTRQLTFTDGILTSET